MKIQLLTVLITATIAIRVQAQDATVREFQTMALKDLKPLDKDGWKKTGTFVVTVNQGALRNWAAGGEKNTLGITTILNYNINHRKGRYTWNNYFDLSFGFQNASSFGRFRKIDDQVDVTSKYGYQFSPHWFTAVLTNINTQVMPGYYYTDSANNKISNFLTPGKVLLSVGFDYRPDKHFSLFISPITTRWILKIDKDFLQVNKFGVPPNKKQYSELGAFATAKYTKSFAPWVTYTGRLDLFSNFKRKPQNVDVYCTNFLNLKINKWMSTTVSVDLLYDDDVMKETQLKEILGIGLAIKL